MWTADKDPFQGARRRRHFCWLEMLGMIGVFLCLLQLAAWVLAMWNPYG